MMPGRNDPCPCGSGRKYKRCCASRDARDAAKRRRLGDVGPDIDDGATAEQIDAQAPWDVELAPLSIEIGSDPTARPAVVLIVARDLVIHAEIVEHAPADPDAVGTLLGDAIVAAVEQLGEAPPEVRVRHDNVADALRERVTSLGIAVRHERTLPSLREASASLRSALLGIDGPSPAISAPHTWAAWGLPAEHIRAIFAAAATFYEAKPWEQIASEEMLELRFPRGARWLAGVLGGAGAEFGLVLYETLDDFARILEGGEPGATFSSMESTVLSLTFSARGDLPKPMRREMAAAKWPVAGPQAYPILWTLNTPGGGLTRAQASELAAALETIARYGAVLAGAEEIQPPEEWVDERSGVVVRWLGSPFEDGDALWEPPAVLTPSLPEGRGAAPGRVLGADDDSEVFERRERAVLDRFAEWLREGGAPEARARRDFENADALIVSLVSQEGISVAAMTEYDLRVFLYDLYPRKFMASRTTATGMRGSLRRFFGFLAERAGIEYPWAAAILRDKEAFEERWESFPGGFWWDPGVREWQAELYDDLHARVMIPPPVLADDGRTHGAMGGDEHRLWQELCRAWLRWRDEVIRGGVTDPNAVREALIARQQEWERQPREGLGGRSARSVVAKERKERGDVELPFG